MRAGHACGTPARTLRPRDRGAVRLRGIGRGEDERLCLFTFARAQFPETFDGARQRELRTAEPFHEVSAPTNPERLERAELSVHGAVTARDSFTAHTVTGDDALPFEQKLGECSRIWTTLEEAIGQRPASLRRRDPGRTLARETAWPSLRR